MVNKKFLSAIVSLVFLFGVLTVPAKAVELGGSIGFMGNIATVDTTGTETETTGDKETNTTTHSEDVTIPAGFVELNFNLENGVMVSLGGAVYPGAASIGAKSRTDTDSAVSSDDDDGTYTAKAEVSDLVEVYVEPTFMFMENAGVFVKAGLARINVEALEDIAIGADSSTYGEETVTGTIFGFGVRWKTDGGMFFKTEYTDTDFDTVSMSSGTGNKNTIDADPSVKAVKFSIGYQF